MTRVTKMTTDLRTMMAGSSVVKVMVQTKIAASKGTVFLIADQMKVVRHTTKHLIQARALPEQTQSAQK